MPPTSEQALDFDLTDNGTDDAVARIASGQRFALAGVLVQFLGAAVQGQGFFLPTLLFLASAVCVGFGAVRITRALGDGLPLRVAVLIGLLIPFVNLLTLLAVNRRASTALRAHGEVVGLLGTAGGRDFWLAAVGGSVLLAAAGAALDRHAASIGLHRPGEVASSVAGLAAQLNAELGAPRLVMPGVRIEGADRHDGDLRIRMRLLDFGGNALRPEQRIRMRDVATEKLCALPAEVRTTLGREQARMMYQVENGRGDAVAQILVTLDDCVSG